MISWPRMQLGDSLSFLTSGSRGWSKYYRDSGALFLRIQNVGYNELRLEDVAFVQPPDNAEAVRTKVQPGDILLSITADLGRTAVIPEGLGEAYANQHLAVLRVNNIDANFLSAFLASDLGQKQLKRLDRVGVKSGLNFDDIRSLQIPLPPLSEQRRIATILNKADAIRRKRKEALALADEFLRFAFLDMFGDPVMNPKGWPVGSIDIVVKKKSDVRCGPFGTQLKVHELVDSGIPLFGTENVHNNQFIPSARKYLTERKASELSAFSIRPGDVLVTRMGTIGRACVVPQNVEDGRISYHLFRVRPDEERCLPEFLASTICRSGMFQTQLRMLSHGAIMAGLSTANLRAVKFLLPPISLQKEYLRYVLAVENMMSQQSMALDKVEALFKSLQQRAFCGKL